MDDALFIEIQQMCRLVHERGLTELSLSREGFAVSLSAVQAGNVVIVPQAHATGMAAAPVVAAPAAPEGYAVASPLIGVFYRAPSPDASNFVEVGDVVEVGQVIGIVEAMKVFNEITTDKAGTVIAIPAESGKLVQVEQPLILIDPLA